MADSTVIEQTFSPDTLDSATVYFWRVDQITPTDTVQGKVWIFETSMGLPEVSISSPESETVFQGTPSDITISADATDGNDSITQVEFFRGIISLGIDSTAPYSHTWKNALAGEHMIYAKATDDQGNTVMSPLVYIKKENNPPYVTIVTPSIDTTYDAPSSITFQANATDSDGTISRVKFYNGSKLLGIDVNSPYTFTWNDISNGQYEITAVATDNYNVTTTSSAILITIENIIVSLTENYEPDINVYPIPADDLLNIDFGIILPNEVNICIFDLSGTILYSTEATGLNKTIDISSLPQGVYLVKISGEGINVVQKITKK
jgi:hypothetical protein